MGGKTLFTPGPVDLLREIREAQTRKMVSHRGNEYRELHEQVVENAKRLFGCGEAFIITGSGTAGVEACAASCIRKGETILVPHNGIFGERLREICALHGAKVISMEFGYGQGISLERIADEIDSAKPSVLAVVYNETSMGVCNKLKEICQYANEKGIFVIVDGVSAIGGHAFNLEEWGAGICVTASQKCIGAPPGIALIGAGEEAIKRIKENKPNAYYLDLKRYIEYNERKETPFTPAVSLLYAVDSALKILLKDGLEERIERHRRAGEYARNELEKAGFGLFAEKGFWSNTVTSFKVSSPAEAESIKKGLEEKYGFTIAGGMGGMKGKILRIGHMGNFKQKDLEKCIKGIVALRG